MVNAGKYLLSSSHVTGFLPSAGDSERTRNSHRDQGCIGEFETEVSLWAEQLECDLKSQEVGTWGVLDGR